MGCEALLGRHHVHRAPIARLLGVVMALAWGLTVAGSTPARADEPAIRTKLAVLELEALGMDREPVARLESLFRMESERLAEQTLPTRRQIQQVISANRQLRRCGGADDCLAAIGRKLGVDLVVTGSVAALGDSFILNIKAVDVATGQKLPKRIATKPLRGSPDELIEAVRVAAYQLLAPGEIHGSINVLTDQVGAQVSIDGMAVGTTPLPSPVAQLPLGEHKVKVTAEGYVPFEETVRVRFQKTTRVVVRMAERVPTGDALTALPPLVRKRPADLAWYSSTWFIATVGVTAALVGGYIGYKLGVDPVIDCGAQPERCQ